jgi:hypothetical protein
MADIDRTGGMMVVLFIALPPSSSSDDQRSRPGNHLLTLRLTVLDPGPDMQVTSLHTALSGRPHAGESPVFVRRAMDELVHRLSRVQHVRRDFAAANRKRSIEEADLDENRSLVPVQVLVRDLVAFEAHDGDERDLDAFSGWRDAGQKPVHADRVSEAHNQFVDDLALPDRPRDGNDLDVRREL